MKDFVHLSSFERTVFGGGEWSVKGPFWLVVQLNRGIAYLHSGQINNELAIGSVTVIPPNSAINILASVLGEASVRGFSINLSSLSGLLTVVERLWLEKEAARECAPFRLVDPSHPLAERVAQCFENREALKLPVRLGFLHAFADWLTPVLEKACANGNEIGEQNPKARLKQLLNQMPESELTELSPGDVAKYLCCGERHASRLFNELCGCSFRKFTSELRLKKACQLLAQGHHKIIDVALESGHSSLSLFNYNFKSRFRMTPTEWRQRHVPSRSRQVAAAVRGAGMPVRQMSM